MRQDTMMEDFPAFMKHPANRIDAGFQHTDDIEGYVFDGADGSQAAFWRCNSDRRSEAHSHPYDEYLVVVAGRYTIYLEGSAVTLDPGSEYYIPKGVPHGGACIAGTRTIHFFGGRRAERSAGA